MRRVLPKKFNNDLSISSSSRLKGTKGERAHSPTGYMSPTASSVAKERIVSPRARPRDHREDYTSERIPYSSNQAVLGDHEADLNETRQRTGLKLHLPKWSTAQVNSQHISATSTPRSPFEHVSPTQSPRASGHAYNDDSVGPASPLRSRHHRKTTSASNLSPKYSNSSPRNLDSFRVRSGKKETSAVATGWGSVFASFKDMDTSIQGLLSSQKRGTDYINRGVSFPGSTASHVNNDTAYSKWRHDPSQRNSQGQSGPAHGGHASTTQGMSNPWAPRARKPTIQSDAEESDEEVVLYVPHKAYPKANIDRVQGPVRKKKVVSGNVVTSLDHNRTSETLGGEEVENVVPLTVQINKAFLKLNRIRAIRQQLSTKCTWK